MEYITFSHILLVRSHWYTHLMQVSLGNVVYHYVNWWQSLSYSPFWLKNCFVSLPYIEDTRYLKWDAKKKNLMHSLNLAQPDTDMVLYVLIMHDLKRQAGLSPSPTHHMQYRMLKWERVNTIRNPIWKGIFWDFPAMPMKNLPW